MDEDLVMAPGSAGGTDSQIVNVDDLSLVKAIFVPILLCVRFS